VFVSSKPYIHKDRVNNFPLFDDDKPNDYIDHSQQKKSVSANDLNHTRATTARKNFKEGQLNQI